MIPTLGYYSIAMGILKAVYMHMAGGNPNDSFNYWVHFWQNLQLNMGIIAACASFLKPLFGRILKLNISAGSHHNHHRYDGSDGTPHGAGASHSKHTASTENKVTINQGKYDDLEMFAKGDHCIAERQVVSPVGGQGAQVTGAQQVSQEAPPSTILPPVVREKGCVDDGCQFHFQQQFV
ncbi:hypothetical protein LZ32DRAFT_680927 [Colletotrichum eremochloae]|nr:hypothetical protein LZ32DRAFT_680927 [Colletotrichum eremochloae]